MSLFGALVKTALSPVTVAAATVKTVVKGEPEKIADKVIETGEDIYDEFEEFLDDIT